MSKKGYLWRYAKLVQKVRQQPYIAKDELLQYLDKEVEYARNLDDDIEMGISARTIERDLREIRNLVGVNIEYSRSNRGYYIEGDNVFGEKALLQMMESYEMYHSLNVAQDLEHIVYPEKEHPAGMEHLYGLIHAIKNRLRIRFVHTKFWDDQPLKRSGKPYALKEFKRRWYVLLHDDGDNRIKVFGLDRISELEITSEKFHVNPVDVEALFAPCFGVTIPDDADPQEVILAFTPFQAKYVKSLPLHHTQRIILDTPDELRISLNVYLTYELEMQILSYGREVQVIQPKMLVDAIKNQLKSTLKQYR